RPEGRARPGTHRRRLSHGRPPPRPRNGDPPPEEGLWRASTKLPVLPLLHHSRAKATAAEARKAHPAAATISGHNRRVVPAHVRRDSVPPRPPNLPPPPARGRPSKSPPTSVHPGDNDRGTPPTTRRRGCAPA